MGERYYGHKSGKGAKLFHEVFPMLATGPELEDMKDRAATYVARRLDGDDLELVLEALGLT